MHSVILLLQAILLVHYLAVGVTEYYALPEELIMGDDQGKFAFPNVSWIEFECFFSANIEFEHC